MKKPQFRVGFELEGLVKYGHQTAFDEGLRNVAPGIDRGTDGSCQGDFTDGFGTGHQGNGIEIRTPVLSLDEGLSLFDKILLFLGEEEDAGRFKTNDTCGLHVNLSEKNMVKNHLRFCRFYAHLVSHFPERRVLKLFNRTDNEFCHPLFVSRGQARADYLELMALASASDFGREKYHSVGLHSYGGATDNVGDTDCGEPEKRRVEFRCLGNTNYHRNFEKLHTALDLIVASANYAYESVLTLPKEGERLRALIKAREENEEIDEYRMPTYIACEPY